MQLDCWSLRCSWSIACWRCSNYIFIFNLTSGFNGLSKDNYKITRETSKFWALVRLILETLRYILFLAQDNRGLFYLEINLDYGIFQYIFKGNVPVMNQTDLEITFLKPKLLGQQPMCEFLASDRHFGRMKFNAIL